MKLYTEAPNRGCLQEGKFGKLVAIIATHRPLNHRIVNFPFNCSAFSLLEITAFFRNERYLFVA